MENTKVKSVANRLVTFPAGLRHRGTSCTDEKIRVVINFDYFKGWFIMNNTKNILYYYHDSCGLGDFYLLFPIFDALRTRHKNDNITLLSNDIIKDIAYNKGWFDNYEDIFDCDFPINRFDRVYNWDIQKHGITLFYPPKKHFWEIISDNLDITLDRDKFPDIFRLNITDEEKHLIDEF